MVNQSQKSHLGFWNVSQNNEGFFLMQYENHEKQSNWSLLNRFDLYVFCILISLEMKKWKRRRGFKVEPNNEIRTAGEKSLVFPHTSAPTLFYIVFSEWKTDERSFLSRLKHPLGEKLQICENHSQNIMATTHNQIWETWLPIIMPQPSKMFLHN